jgi:hypothetical protein
MIWLLATMTTGMEAPQPVLTTVGADRYFVAPGQPAHIIWTAQPARLPGLITFSVCGYQGQPVSTGRAEVSAEGNVSAEVSLAPGYYELDFPEIGQRFGVVASPPSKGRSDPFFCIDSALSWLVADADTREGLIAALHRNGVAMSRERLSWEWISPAKGRWDWESRARFDTLRQTYARHGVPVLEMFHSAPAWSGHVGKYPDDLVAASEAWPQIARHWGPTWGALEIWNEPEIAFGGMLPADQYVPLVKAVAYGLAQQRIDVPLVGGAFCSCRRAFLDTAAANGMLDCTDAVSFHTYGGALEMESLVGRFRQWLAAYGHESAPLWITECGRPWRRGPGRPPVDQDSISALDITMKAVEARACGIARYFAFVYPFFEETQNNFGMMGRQATPLRSMAAYVQSARVLSGKRYLGDISCDDPAVRRARVFGDDRETVAVIYTGQVEPKAKVTVALPVLRIEGIDGRTLNGAVVPSGTAVPVPDGLAYAWLDHDKLPDRLKADTSTMRLWEIGQRPPAAHAAPSPIVLRYQFDRNRLKAAPDGYHLAVSPPGKLPLTVRAFNLGPQSLDLELQIRFSGETARVLDKPARAARIPATSFVDVSWEVELSHALAAEDHLGVVVTAVCKDRDVAYLQVVLGQ